MATFNTGGLDLAGRANVILNGTNNYWQNATNTDKAQTLASLAANVTTGSQGTLANNANPNYTPILTAYQDYFTNSLPTNLSTYLNTVGNAINSAPELQTINSGLGSGGTLNFTPTYTPIPAPTPTNTSPVTTTPTPTYTPPVDTGGGGGGGSTPPSWYTPPTPQPQFDPSGIYSQISGLQNNYNTQLSGLKNDFTSQLGTMKTDLTNLFNQQQKQTQAATDNGIGSMDNRAMNKYNTPFKRRNGQQRLLNLGGYSGVGQGASLGDLAQSQIGTIQ